MKNKHLNSAKTTLESMKAEETVFTEALGNYPIIRVLDHLIIGKDFDYSISDIAEGAEVGWTTIHEILPKLEKLGIVKQTRRIGMAKLYRINTSNPVAAHIINLHEKLMKESIDRIIEKQKVKAVH